MSTTRRRSATTTRAALLAAARTRFGAEGYEGTTLRALAGDVGVDAAMVARYFGTKERLFAEAAEFELHLPDLTRVAPERFADVLMPHFFAVFEQDGTFLPLLRASVTHERAATAMQDVFARQVAPALAVVAPDHPRERAALVGAQILGLALSRYVLRLPPLVAMSREDATRWIAPVLQHYLRSPSPRGVPLGPLE